MNLVTVQGDMTLEPVTAAAWQAMKAESYRTFGVELTITSPAGAYRSDALVRDMYLNKSKYGIPASQPVAKPRSLGGRGSVHESGRCIDVWNHTSIPRKSLVALAATHGFTFTIASEPWHMQHDGSGGGSGGGTEPDQPDADRKTIYRKEPEMLSFTLKDNYGRLGPANTVRSYLVGPNFFRDTTNDPTRNQVSVLANGYAFRDDGTPFIPPSPDLTYAELYGYAEAAGVTGAALEPYRKAVTG